MNIENSRPVASLFSGHFDRVKIKFGNFFGHSTNNIENTSNIQAKNTAKEIDTTFKTALKGYIKSGHLTKKQGKYIQNEIKLLSKTTDMPEVKRVFITKLSQLTKKHTSNTTSNFKSEIGSHVFSLNQRPLPQEKTIAQLAYTALEETKSDIYSSKHTNTDSANPQKNEYELTTKDGKRIRYEETADTHRYDPALHNNKGWMGSGDWRSAYAAKELGMSFEKLENMPNFRVNARTHKLDFEIGEKKETLVMDRGGALTDFRDGSTNIQQIIRSEKELRSNLQGLDTDYNEILDTLPVTIRQYLSHPSQATKTKELKAEERKLLTNYLLLKLSVGGYENDILKEFFEQTPEKSLETLCKDNKTTVYDLADKIAGDVSLFSQDPSTVPMETVSRHVQLLIKGIERQHWLNEQMLQRLESAFKNEPPSENASSYLLCQMSLLDEKVAKQKHGFDHNEKNFLLDSSFTYDQFDGATIRFSDEATMPSYIEEKNGKISTVTIPWPKEKQALNDIKLTSLFFNQSVQGHTDNNKLLEQKKINESGIEKLRNYIDSIKEEDKKQFPEELTEIEERLKSGESSYELSRDIVLLAKKLGGSVGINCFSGKDRTGELIAQVIKKHIANRALAENTRLTQAEEKKIAKNLHSEQGIARQVAFQNVGVAALKIKKISIEGMSIANRIRMALQARKAAA